MKRESRAFYSTVAVTGFGYAAQVLSLFAIPLFLRTVGTEDYGLMVTVMAFMGYINFADAGLSWGAMILIAQSAGRKDRAETAHIVRHAVVLALGSGLLVLLVVGVLLGLAGAGWRLPMFSAHPKADVLLLIAGVQLFATLQFAVVYNLFQGLQENYWTGVYQGLGRMLGLIGGIAVAWYSGNIAHVMLAQCGAMILCSVAASVHVWRRHPWAFVSGDWMDRAQYLAQLRIGLKNFLIQIGRTLAATAPTLAISSIVGPASVPFYTVPLTLLGLFFVPINSWNASMQGAYGEAWAAGDRGWVRDAFRDSLLRALVVGGLGLALFLALGDSFVRLWTHTRLWVEPVMAVSVSLVVVTGAILGSGQYLLISLNRHGRVALAELANGLVAILLVVGVVKVFGPAAAGVGVVVAALLTSAWVVHRAVVTQLGAGCLPGVVPVAKTIAAMFGGGLAASQLAGVMANGAGGVGLFSLCCAGLAGLGVFVVSVVVLRVLPPSVVRMAWLWLRRRIGLPLPGAEGGASA